MNNNEDLKIYICDRVMPIAYIEMTIGLIAAVVPTAILLIFKSLFFTKKGGLTDGGIVMLVAATILFWVGIAVIAAGNYKRGVCEHGFFAERDGHVYVFSINPARISEGNTIGFGTVGKLYNSFNQINNSAYYTDKIDSLRQSKELLDEVNKILDDNYSSLYSFRDLQTAKYTRIERFAFTNEYKRLAGVTK